MAEGVKFCLIAVVTGMIVGWIIAIIRMIMGSNGAVRIGAILMGAICRCFPDGQITAHAAEADAAVPVTIDMVAAMRGGGEVTVEIAAHGVDGHRKAAFFGQSQLQIAGHAVHGDPVGDIGYFQIAAGGSTVKIQSV